MEHFYWSSFYLVCYLLLRKKTYKFYHYEKDTLYNDMKLKLSNRDLSTKTFVSTFIVEAYWGFFPFSCPLSFDY